MDRAPRVGALLVALTGCSAPELPPLGEAVVVVDTDVPVPLLAGALQLDLYAPDGGRWYASFRIDLPDARDWPASFSLFAPEELGAGEALVRVRVHPRQRRRDYQGERYLGPPPEEQDPFDAWIAPDGDLEPRLYRRDADLTPPDEPEPGVSIDRLLRVSLREGETGYLPVVLRGACLGTQADLATQRSCVDTPGQLAPATVAALEVSPPASVERTFGAPMPCAGGDRDGGAPLYDGRVCVDGGAFIFGNREHFGLGPVSGVPERVAVVAPFVIDRYEVSVARYRDALARGLASAPDDPSRNELPGFPPLRTINNQRMCSYSEDVFDREALALTCISQTAAREFCRFEGGDLPTEAQWEMVAQVSGRNGETRYAWGDEPPTCDRAVYGRVNDGPLAVLGIGVCTVTTDVETAGPSSVDSRDGPGGDVSLGLGVVGLGGGVSEYVQDAFASLDAVCWARQPLDDPSCDAPVGEDAVWVARGGGWGSNTSGVYAGQRLRVRQDTPVPAVGFRCVYPPEGTP